MIDDTMTVATALFIGAVLGCVVGGGVLWVFNRCDRWIRNWRGS